MRSFGTAGDWLSYPRVLAAGIAVAIVGGLIGYLFDLLVGPSIGMSGWWTVTGFGGLIFGLTAQAVREYAEPLAEPVDAAPDREA